MSMGLSQHPPWMRLPQFLDWLGGGLIDCPLPSFFYGPRYAVAGPVMDRSPTGGDGHCSNRVQRMAATWEYGVLWVGAE